MDYLVIVGFLEPSLSNIPFCDSKSKSCERIRTMGHGGNGTVISEKAKNVAWVAGCTTV